MNAALLMAATIASHAPAPVAHNEAIETVDVAYEALVRGKAEEAAARIEANTDLDQADPARLLNLATALASMGRTAEARELYSEAEASGDAVFLETADGRWVSARTLARAGKARIDDGSALALR